MQLGAARIFVRDIVEAKAFYSDRLGLSVEAADLENGFCMFDTGATKLIVEAIGADDEQGRELVGRFTGLSFPVSDIQAKYRELTALGVTFSGAPEQQPWGGWLASFEDPAGNGLQLVQRPAGTKRPFANNKALQHVALAAIVFGGVAAYVRFAGDVPAGDLPAAASKDSKYVRSVTYENGSSQVERQGPPLRYASNRRDLELARAFGRRGDFAAAEKVLRDVLARTPDESPAAHELGTMLFLQGDYAASERTFRNLLQQDPEWVQARVGLGAVARVQGRYGDAVEQYSLALKSDANDALSYYGRGISYFHLGETSAAEADLTRTIELLPPAAELAAQASEYLDTIKKNDQ